MFLNDLNTQTNQSILAVAEKYNFSENGRGKLWKKCNPSQPKIKFAMYHFPLNKRNI